VPVGEDALQPFFETLNQTLDRAGLEHVVGIEKEDELPRSLLQATVRSLALTAVGLPHVADRRIASSDSRGIVRRAVVDHDHFHLGVALPESALDCRGEKTAVVVTRDHHGDESHREQVTSRRADQ
jgi:hypothetical protein